jgi:hypothetical protein
MHTSEVTQTQTNKKNLRRLLKCQEESFCKVLRIEYTNLPIRTPCALQAQCTTRLRNKLSLPSISLAGESSLFGARSPPALCSISADYPYHPRVVIYYPYTSIQGVMQGCPCRRVRRRKIPSRRPGVDPSGAQTFCTLPSIQYTTMVIARIDGVLRAAKNIPSPNFVQYSKYMRTNGQHTYFKD